MFGYQPVGGDDLNVISGNQPPGGEDLNVIHCYKRLKIADLPIITLLNIRFTDYNAPQHSIYRL